MLPKPIQELIDELCRLPGVGPKTAERLAFHLLRTEQRNLDSFSEAVAHVKKKTLLCETCFNITEQNPCAICDNPHRDGTLICVVEEPLDIYAIEKTATFRGLYHVLHGTLSPIDNMGPADLKIKELLERISAIEPREIILALNPTPKGEATTLYLSQKIKEAATEKGVKVSHLARGLPLGGEIEYADFQTLGSALSGRVEC